MMRLFFACWLLCRALSLSAQLQPPGDFLPHALGEQFTPHHLLVDYVQHVAAESDRVQRQTYGHTYQGRPLLLCAISSPANLAQLEAIRTNNLRRTGHLPGPVDPALDRAIVWLSFSIHGNEAAGAEASMAVLHQLADPENAQTATWLQHTVVLLDPVLNPDGYDRYTHWYRNVATRRPDPAPFAREHREPWPGGRGNHYLFDLNRDWAWQTQVESRQRVAQYHRWMPHIHADLHEQYPENPYYFAPAAHPYHAYITEWQASFQKVVGANHARHFDEKGWLYFTGEIFDLLYPSYGDSWPTFNGAIGMTYEQGGHSLAGRAFRTENGDTLTLSDRIAHHVTTALSTVEVADRHREEILQEVGRYFERSRTRPPGPYKTYVIKNDGSRRIEALASMLDRNGIRYGSLPEAQRLKGWRYTTGRKETFDLQPADLVVSAYQPGGVLAQVMLDPFTELEDSLTYDITSWSLPYAYGLEAYAVEQRVAVSDSFAGAQPGLRSAKQDRLPYGWLMPWNSLQHAAVFGQLQQQGIRVRVAEAPISAAGRDWAPGTLLITRADNRKLPLQQLLAPWAAELIPVYSGQTPSGPDLGSEAFRLLKPIRIALLSGKEVRAGSMGQVWHLLETELDMPVHILPMARLDELDFDQFDLLILPEGRYELSEAQLEPLKAWVREGGKLIAIGRALSSLEEHSFFGLRQAKQAVSNPQEDEWPLRYSEASRASISSRISGAVFRTGLDPTHPLAFGLPNPYFSLKNWDRPVALLEEGWNVAYLEEELFYRGFVGAEVKQKLPQTLVAGVVDRGAGHLVYLVDDPLFRGFWESGKLLFCNALFLVD